MEENIKELQVFETIDKTKGSLLRKRNISNPDYLSLVSGGALPVILTLPCSLPDKDYEGSSGDPGIILSLLG